ncbi:MAG: iron chelate uptake ABC transporter family permease subunit [Acidaminococcaceae bacterium]|nr:iron chelate uptake ABC transporter family permease subunit [Acidaminococcaceae bacterium]
MGGGSIGVWADIFSRTIITGREFPLGVVISLLGSPIFILLLIMRAKGFYRRVI